MGDLHQGPAPKAFMSFIRTDDQISIYRGQEWLLDAVTDFDVGAQET